MILVLLTYKVFLGISEFYHLSGVVYLGLNRRSPLQHRVNFTRLLFGFIHFNWSLWRIDIYNVPLLFIMEESILIILNSTNGRLRADVDFALLFYFGGLRYVGK